ncbi:MULTISPECIES: type I-E CRISPR-associated endonuclease Cas1e [unclassified Streptomyces]|uniref:type I-E CRISPR-associated endonuclease Cas1e n=1 Tax=unclassified Streptomyces TaxID=2593676 RepID=UPI00342A2426
MLPRVADSLSFLYLDMVRIVQDDTGVCAQIQVDPDRTDTVYIPTAAISCLLLGPGVSITTRALATLARHGTTVIPSGAGGVRTYAGILPDSLTTHWLERQTYAWADPQQRLDVAVRMYRMRFDDSVPEAVTLAQLRGMEGQRMKALYRILAQQHGIGRFRRNYHPDQWDQQDPVNLALSAANTCLYGIVHAALLALGCSLALPESDARRVLPADAGVFRSHRGRVMGGGRPPRRRGGVPSYCAQCPFSGVSSPPTRGCSVAAQVGVLRYRVLRRQLTLYGVSLDRVRADRVLGEALATGVDPLHLTAIFDLAESTAAKYAALARQLLHDPTDLSGTE